MAKESKLREMARKRVEFKMHLFWYIVINVMLFVINIVTSPSSLWFYWITIFWGVGVVGHWFSTYHGEESDMVEREYRRLEAQQRRKRR